MATTNLTTQPAVPQVKRFNRLPLYIALFVVALLIGSYFVVLLNHQKKELVASFHQQWTRGDTLYKPDVTPVVTKLPEKTEPPKPAPEKTEEDPWTKLARENQLKWAQVQWDELFKREAGRFDRSEKLTAQRFTERLAAYRASSAVDLTKSQVDKASTLVLPRALLASRQVGGRPGVERTDKGAPQTLVTQNNTQGHVPFGSAALQTPQVSTASLVPPASPYLLRQGTHIPVVLDQWLNSDAQGAWTARVSADVYDSLRSHSLLIPAGSTLFGFSEVDMRTNQQPVLMLAARTLHLPNGESLDLGRTFAQNGQGIQGLSDEVNRHLLQRYGSAVVLSLITAGIRMASYNYGGHSNGFYLSPGDAAAQGFGDVLGRTAGEELRRTMNIRPTVTVPLGYAFNVTLTQDFYFPGQYQEAAMP